MHGPITTERRLGELIEMATLDVLQTEHGRLNLIGTACKVRGARGRFLIWLWPKKLLAGELPDDLLELFRQYHEAMAESVHPYQEHGDYRSP
jgi:hypothetical protein